MSLLPTWVDDNEALLWSVAAASAVMFFGTLLAMPVLIARVPTDYFVRGPVRERIRLHTPLYLLGMIAKNLLGMVLVVVGIAMLVLPGQGVLTVLMGLVLVDFPGKRRLERWLIRRRPIFRAANWIRARRGRPPLQLPAPGAIDGAEKD